MIILLYVLTDFITYDVVTGVYLPVLLIFLLAFLYRLQFFTGTTVIITAVVQDSI